MNNYGKSKNRSRFLIKLRILSVVAILSVPILSAMIFVSGCAVFRSPGPHVYDAEALKSADRIKNTNRGLKSFRGIGWIYISDRAQRQKKFRIAFAALPPDKIRLTLMISGFPVETIIADGKKIIFLSHTKKHKIYTINSPNPSLERIISIPVKVQDVIALLSGRIPLKTFDYAFFANKGKTMSTTLVLNKKRGGMIQKIISDPNEFVRQYELFDDESHLIYSILFNNFKISGTFKIPLRFKIADKSGRTLEMKITGYKANVPVNNSVFSLKESG